MDICITLLLQIPDVPERDQMVSPWPRFYGLERRLCRRSFHAFWKVSFHAFMNSCFEVLLDLSDILWKLSIGSVINVFDLLRKKSIFFQPQFSEKGGSIAKHSRGLRLIVMPNWIYIIYGKVWIWWTVEIIWLYQCLKNMCICSAKIIFDDIYSSEAHPVCYNFISVLSVGNASQPWSSSKSTSRIDK